MSDKYTEEMKKIRGARIALLAKHPFFGDLAFGLPLSFDDTLNPPTAATNGQWIKFHPKLIERLTPSELVFALGHEVLHPALMHTLRCGPRDHKKWNLACDIVANHMLIEHGIGTAPSFIYYKKELYIAGGGKVEKIYDLIPDEDADKQYDNVEATPEDAMADVAADMRVKLHQALQAAKRAGASTGTLEQFVENLTVPKVNWRNVLRSFFMTTRGAERTYARRNRRYAPQGIMIPGTYGDKAGEYVFAPDCSGSTDDEMIAQCAAEIQSIMEELRPEKLHVIYWDTEVKKHDVYECDDELNVKIYGRGGTRPQCIFEYLEEQGIEAEKVIVATDLEFYGDIGPEPDVPVLWAVMQGSRQDVAWGQVMVVE